MDKDAKVILDIIIKQGYICLDFNDISNILSNSGFFKIIETMGKQEGSRVAEALLMIDRKLSEQERASAERIIISLFFNPDVQPAITMDEIKPLSDFLANQPEEITTYWGIFRDDQLTTGEVRLSTIISGKELKP